MILRFGCHPISSRIRQSRNLNLIFITWTNTGMLHCLSDPNWNAHTSISNNWQVSKHVPSPKRSWKSFIFIQFQIQSLSSASTKQPASLHLAQQSALPGRFTPNLVALRSITTTCHMQLSPGKAFLYGPLSPVLPFLLRKTALLSLHLDGKREAISQTFILLTFPFSAPAAAKSTEVSPSSSCSGKVILQTPKFYFSLPYSSLPYLTQIGL